MSTNPLPLDSAVLNEAVTNTNYVSTKCRFNMHLDRLSAGLNESGQSFRRLISREVREMDVGCALRTDFGARGAPNIDPCSATPGVSGRAGGKNKSGPFFCAGNQQH